MQIDRERGGEEIDQALVKETVNIYVEIANGAQSFYEKDFEATMINATKKFYSEKASEWITNESYDNYLLKVCTSCSKQLAYSMFVVNHNNRNKVLNYTCRCKDA